MAQTTAEGNAEAAIVAAMAVYQNLPITAEIETETTVADPKDQHTDRDITIAKTQFSKN